jgi:hypothetical protein
LHGAEAPPRAKSRPQAEKLLQKQFRFTRMTAQWLAWAHANGYEVTTGDGYRDPRVFGEMGVRQGYGESRSAHKQRLAHDWNLFKDGVFLGRTEDHRPLGEEWERLGGVWGGRFNDGNHYSLEHGGVS